MENPDTSSEDHYTSGFRAVDDTSRRSAEIILPMLITQLRNGLPRSVLDLGSGVGSWLATWRALGVSDIHGVDGGWITPPELVIPAESFETHDLTQPYNPGRGYDVSMSLEVAPFFPEVLSPWIVVCVPKFVVAESDRT